MVDLSYVQRVSVESGFSIETIEKVVRLLDFLRDIDKHPLLGRVLALKGGTALNLFYGPPPRMSVDLDFNYVGEPDRGQMLAERPEVERATETLAHAQGYQIQLSSDAHAGRTYHLSYRNLLATSDRVQIDLNFLHRVPIGGTVRRAAWAPSGSTSQHANLVSTAELFAGKFRAFLDRVAPRDAFDMARIPDLANGEWHEPRTRAVAVAMAGTLPHPMYQLSPRFDSGISPDVLEERLHPMLIAGALPDPEELLQNALRAVMPLLEEPTDAEREYIECINRGELRPQLLFPDDEETAERLQRHPALLWKAENARRHRGS